MCLVQSASHLDTFRFQYDNVALAFTSKCSVSMPSACILPACGIPRCLHSAVFAGALPGFADIAVYNMIRDDGILYSPVDLAAYPNLQRLYSAVAGVPEVREWVQSWEQPM
jgi:hypothetical protein